MDQHSVRYVDVATDSDGQRLDNFLLKTCKKVPKTLIYRWVRKGEVRVNKKRAKADQRVQTGDTVRIPPVRQASIDSPILSQSWQRTLQQAVLYEDEHIMILNKPSGLAVHGGSGENSGLIENLRALRSDCRFLELVHRLDKETSGCLLIAKDRQTLTALHEQLRQQDMKKTYHAIVYGRWPKAVNKVDLPLEKHSGVKSTHRTHVSAQGKAALTTFNVIESFSDQATLVAAKLYTGRTHQIRVHTQATGHAVVGDRKYAQQPADFTYPIKRLYLHAMRLQLTVSWRDEPITVTAPYDDVFDQLLMALRHEAPTI